MHLESHLPLEFLKDMLAKQRTFVLLDLADTPKPIHVNLTFF